MKLKNYWKRFWTLDRHHAEGFTLVELIVVIAILAILAGVGIPVYSGYITKANIGVDQNLVGEVAQALQLQYYNDTASAACDYVVLSVSGASAGNGDGSFADKAMTAAFGNNWEDNISLSYSDWVSDGMMNIALDQFYIGSVSDSSFLSNSTVPELLDNVQVITLAASELLSSVKKTPEQYINSLRTTLGEGYLEAAVEAGIMKNTGTASAPVYEFVNYELNEGEQTLKITDDLKTQLSNLMVVSVARDMNKLSDADAAGLMTGNLSQQANPTTATQLAAQYAAYKAAALAIGPEGTARLAVVDGLLADATNMKEVTTALDAFIKGADGVLDDTDKAFRSKVQTYSADENGITAAYNTDAQAFAAIMGAVNDVTDPQNTHTTINYVNAETLKNAELFTSSSVSSQLNSFADAAEVMRGLSSTEIAALKAAMTGADPGEIVVFITSNGAIAVNVNSAYPAG